MNAKHLLLVILLAVVISDVSADWIQTKGPYGGRVRAFCVIGARLLAGTQYGGVFLSTAGNTKWIGANTGMPLPSDVRSFAVSGSKVYAGSLGHGVFVSADTGATWTSISSGISNQYIECLAADGDNLVAGVYGRVFVSANGGTSWIPATAGLPTQQIFELVASGSTFLTSTIDSVLQSTDHGMSWHTSNSGLENRQVYSFTSGGVVLLAGTDKGVFLSTDHGSTWSPINAGLEQKPINALAVSGTDIYAGSFGKGVFRSTDNGATWTLPDSGFVNATVRALTIVGTTVVAGTNDGAYISTDRGATWTSVKEGLAATLVVSLATSGEYLFAGLDEGGVQRSTDDGETWANVGLTSMKTLSILALAADGPRIFAGADPGGVFRSTDAGETWTPVNIGLPDTFYTYCLSVSGTTLLAGSNLGISRSSNLGKDWEPAAHSPQQVVAFTRIGSRAIASAWWNGLYSSSDDGQHWFGSGSGLPDNSVAALITSGARVYVATTDGVYLTSDSARTWRPAGLENIMPAGFALHERKLFAAGYSGTYVCTDFDSVWHQVNAGLGRTDVQAIAARDTMLFVGGYGGVWRRPVSEMSEDEGPPALPLAFSLEQNYPNPFNATTIISGQWTEESAVRLVVYDLLGREVVVLANGRYPAGKHSFTFNGGSLASGIYFYRLTADNRSFTMKMVLLK